MNSPTRLKAKRTDSAHSTCALYTHLCNCAGENVSNKEASGKCQMSSAPNSHVLFPSEGRGRSGGGRFNGLLTESWSPLMEWHDALFLPLLPPHLSRADATQEQMGAQIDGISYKTSLNIMLHAPPSWLKSKKLPVLFLYIL